MSTSPEAFVGGGGAAFEPFEGCEKKILLTFQRRVPSDDKPLDLMEEVPRKTWDRVLHEARCCIISETRTPDVRAFVLSESSLFVTRNSVMLKTCGTTTLLHCLSTMLSELAQLCAVVPLFVQYSRANFMFPNQQPFPHISFAMETDTLLSFFPTGQSHVLGPVNGPRWHCFFADLRTPTRAPLRLPHKVPPTLELLMFDLDPKAMEMYHKHCAKNHPQSPKTHHEANTFGGVDKIIPNAILDGFLFEPCGYSCNGLVRQEDRYFTLHVTPEPDCCFVSFETNVSRADYTPLVQRVLDTFRPGRFTVSLFCDRSEDAVVADEQAEEEANTQAVGDNNASTSVSSSTGDNQADQSVSLLSSSSFASAVSSAPGLGDTYKGFSRQQATVQEFDGGFSVRVARFVSTKSAAKSPTSDCKVAPPNTVTLQSLSRLHGVPMPTRKGDQVTNDSNGILPSPSSSSSSSAQSAAQLCSIVDAHFGLPSTHSAQSKSSLDPHAPPVSTKSLCLPYVMSSKLPPHQVLTLMLTAVERAPHRHAKVQYCAHHDNNKPDAPAAAASSTPASSPRAQPDDRLLEVVPELVERQDHAADEPFYSVDIDCLASRFQQWAQRFPRLALCHPVGPGRGARHPSALGLVRALAAVGCGFNASTVADVRALLHQGVAPGLITLTQPFKSPATFRAVAPWQLGSLVVSGLADVKCAVEVCPSTALVVSCELEDVPNSGDAPADEDDDGMADNDSVGDDDNNSNVDDKAPSSPHCLPTGDAKKLLDEAGALGAKVVGVRLEMPRTSPHATSKQGGLGLAAAVRQFMALSVHASKSGLHPLTELHVGASAGASIGRQPALSTASAASSRTASPTPLDNSSNDGNLTAQEEAELDELQHCVSDLLPDSVCVWVQATPFVVDPAVALAVSVLAKRVSETAQCDKDSLLSHGSASSSVSPSSRSSTTNTNTPASTTPRSLRTGAINGSKPAVAQDDDVMMLQFPAHTKSPHLHRKLHVSGGVFDVFEFMRHHHNPRHARSPLLRVLPVPRKLPKKTNPDAVEQKNTPSGTDDSGNDDNNKKLSVDVWEPVTLLGPSCDPADVIAQNLHLPAGIEVGDWLCFPGVGPCLPLASQESAAYRLPVYYHTTVKQAHPPPPIDAQ